MSAEGHYCENCWCDQEHGCVCGLCDGESGIELQVAYLQETFEQIMTTVERIYGAESWDNDDFAREVAMRGGEDSWAMFALLDGKDIYPMVLKRNKPEAFITPVVAHGEDVA